VSTYAIRRRGLQAEIQDIVKRYIIDHRFKPGDALPGEGELAKQMGISRPSLREAMKVLQTIGVVETRHGSGTYVGSLSLNPLADGMAFQILIAAQHSDGAPQDLLDLVDLRGALETSQIRKVTGQHSPEQIAKLRSLCDEMANLDNESPGFNERDLALHQLFYQPLESRVYSEFIRMFWRISNLAIWPYAKNSRETILQEHQAIVDALANHDADSAAEAVRAHIEGLACAIKSSYDPESLNVAALEAVGVDEPAS
jgi:DNA-binding FadR family transcriptional regulator